MCFARLVLGADNAMESICRGGKDPTLLSGDMVVSAAALYESGTLSLVDQLGAAAGTDTNDEIEAQSGCRTTDGRTELSSKILNLMKSLTRGEVVWMQKWTPQVVWSCTVASDYFPIPLVAIIVNWGLMSPVLPLF